VRVEGLETMDYLDLKKERCTEQGDAIVFESEVGVLLTVKYVMLQQ
jgi:glucose-6-phosphate 1-epimerase